MTAATDLAAVSRPALKELRIVLHFPPKELSPNARVHWSKKSKAVREYRNWAWAEARLALTKAFRKAPGWAKADVHVTFYLPDRRRRDPDNLMASCKPIFDGLQDARIVANDCGLVHWPPTLAVDAKNPRVELILTEVRG